MVKSKKLMNVGKNRFQNVNKKAKRGVNFMDLD